MLDAAELAALALVQTAAAREQAQVIDGAGKHVHLGTELGDPEAVDHVRRREIEIDRRRYRNVELVRSLRIAVSELPPPLMSGGRDAHRRRDAGAVDLGHRAKGEDEHDPADESRRRGPRDLESTVALEHRRLSGE